MLGALDTPNRRPTRPARLSSPGVVPETTTFAKHDGHRVSLPGSVGPALIISVAYLCEGKSINRIVRDRIDNVASWRMRLTRFEYSRGPCGRGLSRVFGG